MTAPPVLDVADLRVSIRGDEGIAKILDHISFRLERGRILGIVGESGCGKSTLIKSVLGILSSGARIERGEIRFEGENLLAMGDKRLNREIRGSRIGFIPQDPYLALNPVFTVGAQLLEIMRWHAPKSVRNHREHLIALLRRVQLPDPEAALDRYPHQFSGGQRQRLVIAGALACAPTLIVADEPTTALDVTTQGQILVLLRELVEEFGLSMLFVTHDLGVVAELCDDLCVIYAGQSVETGPTVQVLREPAHPYTRALLACHPDRSEHFTGIPGLVPSPLKAPPGCRFAPRCTSARPACPERPPHYVAAGQGHAVDCILHEGSGA
ncbi:ABC transporter ATP-binding protein [Enterovirga rhinocerotis]|uniref:Peptide/nickel transport system ATP-binding protein n=1 Tax=Enterovirga rhinocerotis TaxID=1339210 RepID=A0A4R7BVC4_9HYPH|nr:ABC transporter ATP-binding protein [Enterovirga rhinocerotis]TDR89780.1 peptide/nickel transport system ATP-binding protein [Enterovirga rhinocerotis]